MSTIAMVSPEEEQAKAPHSVYCAPTRCRPRLTNSRKRQVRSSYSSVSSVKGVVTRTCNEGNGSRVGDVMRHVCRKDV